MKIHFRRPAAAAALAAGILLVGSACSSAGTPGQAGGSGAPAEPVANVQADPAVAALVPAELKNRPLVNAIYNDAPPQNFLQNGNLVGVQLDIAHALAGVMGVKFDNVGIGNFDTLIPGIQAGRYDLSTADFGVTKEREKVIDFVYQFDLGTSFAVKKGSSISIKSDTDLCGRSVALLAGSYFLPQAEALSAGCVQAGKPALQVQKFPTQSAAILAVNTGRVEAYGASNDQIVYLGQQSNVGVSAQPFVYGAIPQGIGMPKGSKLTPAVVAGLKKLIDNGEYGRILAKWGIASAAIPADKVVSSPIPGAI